ncbi:Uncharacterized protein OS=Planctomyces maris DSM 8797 GN=PM8797T_23941 PE=4 SV=1 [Gemmata massiliana]|uniref:Uncharacterized protein n=1 Tax=Gemmata massiliana TaxID=1210884 RepID=A0A6P2D6U1_9BACT|nr:hypothetical protein [Gemmata massiliana]VTR96175.1 Uncharacterized protein OS=Planctomyces maris DSM 8797 GN=PM8797T_23941 PE=4 SV=1 [Gemmata massiliana]
MNALSLAFLLVAADPDDGLAKKMLPVYVKEAETYSIAVESAPKKALELNKEPVFAWANPTRDKGQQGVIFLWLRDGRPAALICIFSHPFDKPTNRNVNHELHALDPDKLLVTRSKGALTEWKPEAGLTRKGMPDAPAPADTPAARLLQMKRLAAEFTGHSVDREQKKWELRLLPTPLYRYPVSKTGVIDGARFALVSNAGTDPEVLLLIEAKEDAGKIRWEYVCCRFSDWELRVARKDKEVFASVPGGKNTTSHDPLHLYRNFSTRVVTAEGKLLARYRPAGPDWGELVPVEDK